MAYEVEKRIAGRGYRYRVESVRDTETGKRRNRWTYLGRAEPAGGRATEPPKRRTDARERLLDALERLLATRDFAGLTADAVATEAGLAHGTFYRHFKDKRDALKAALERVRERRGPVIDALDDAVPDERRARAAIVGMVESALRKQAQHPDLLRALYALAERDVEFARERRERKTALTRRLAEHLAALTARGIATVSDPGTTAAAILAIVEGFYREAVVDATAIGEDRVAGAAEVVERAVFARPARKGLG